EPGELDPAADADLSKGKPGIHFAAGADEGAVGGIAEHAAPDGQRADAQAGADRAAVEEIIGAVVDAGDDGATDEDARCTVDPDESGTIERIRAGNAGALDVHADVDGTQVYQVHAAARVAEAADQRSADAHRAGFSPEDSRRHKAGATL